MARRLSLSLLSVLLLVAAPLLLAADGPPFWDRQRGIQKQEDAARAAVDKVRSKPGAKAIIEILGSPSAYVRDDVFEELLRWPKEDLLPLAAGLGVRDFTIVTNLAELFGRKKVEGARETLEEALRKHRHPIIQAEIAYAIGNIGNPESKRNLERVLKRARDPRVGAACLIALARVDADGAVDRLEEAVRDSDPPLQIAALHELTNRNPIKGAAAAVEALGARVSSRYKAWKPRRLFQILASLRAVTGKKAASDSIVAAIEKLIPRLGEEEGRAHHEIGETLRHLTGQWDLGDSEDTWAYWWKAQKDSFDPASVKPGDKSGGNKKGRETVVRYHGIPIYSKRICFMLDLSGGMDRPIDPDSSDSPRRVDFAKRELVKVLKELEDDVAVNIIFFASDFNAAAEQLVPLKSRRGRALLLDFVRKQKLPTKVHTNRGNIYDPLVTALEDPTVDTVFLLSEGNPTEGLYHERDRFIRHLKQRNLLPQTKVHTLFIGNAKSAERYCREISEATDGRYYGPTDIPGAK